MIGRLGIGLHLCGFLSFVVFLIDLQYNKDLEFGLGFKYFVVVTCRVAIFFSSHRVASCDSETSVDQFRLVSICYNQTKAYLSLYLTLSAVFLTGCSTQLFVCLY